jgi:hypothetical protein
LYSQKERNEVEGDKLIKDFEQVEDEDINSRNF